MLKPYNEYKPIPELWITKIPESWSYRKIKFLFNERSEKGYPNEVLLVASQNMGVVPKDVYGNRTVEAQKNLHLLKLVKVGDFVISLRSFQGGIEYAYYQGIISPAYTVMEPKEEINPGYFRHLAKSRLFIELLQMCVTGIREGQNIDYSKLKNHLIPVPPKEEQNQIVRFLDWKLSKINKLIRAKKKQIALLNEHKQVIINNAITKGLDSKVSMKNSGIEWIGETPTTWKIKRLKNVATTFGRIGFRGYSTVDLVDNEEDGAITTSPSNIKEDSMSFEKCSYLTWEKYEESPEIQLRENDILIVKTGSSYGKTGFIDSLPKKATINPQLLIVRNRSNELHSKFLYFVIKSRYFQDQIKCEIIGSTIPTISETKILSFFLAIPPKDVQEKLLVYIESVIDKHRLAIKKIEDEISLLQEYRIRLISDVVTGKIDVSDIEIPEYETDSDDFTDDEIDDNLVLDEEDGEMEVE